MTRRSQSPHLTRRGLIVAGAAAGLSPLLPRTGLAQMLGADGGQAYSRMIGDIEVVAILDGFFPLGADLMLNVGEQEIADALADARLNPEGGVPTTIAAHLLRTGERTVLIDTGAPAAFAPTVNRLAAGLSAAGVEPSAVDTILVSHMHPDHIGGMLGEGGPVFPNAEVRVAETELAFWTDENVAAEAPKEAQPFFELARAVADAYADQIAPFSGEADLAPGVTGQPLPGHTPGHTGFLIASGDAALLHWTDVVHMAPVQFRHPGASIAFDTDPEQAAATRRAVLERAASEGLLVSGAHLPFPTFGFVAEAADGYRWEPETWQHR